MQSQCQSEQQVMNLEQLERKLEIIVSAMCPVSLLDRDSIRNLKIGIKATEHGMIP